MRKFLIAGNWKMNLRLDSSIELARSIVAGSLQQDEVELLICPTFVHLNAVANVVSGSAVSLGGQNLYAAGDGAFTGEINAAMLTDIGCQYVILGHSERRSLMDETSETVNLKLRQALQAGLIPIVCVGESLEQRENGETLDVVQAQFELSLGDLAEAQIRQVVIAYEPVWAIGTGKVATPEQAQEVHADLRKIAASRYNSPLAESMRILYGGSVKPDNSADLMSQPDIDGALVGGASLDADSFLAIASACPAKVV